LQRAAEPSIGCVASRRAPVRHRGLRFLHLLGLDAITKLSNVKDVITAGDFYDLAEGAQIIFP